MDVPDARFVAYRLKSSPEDFVVDEIPDPALTRAGDGPYGLYRLSKRHLGTTDVLDHLARTLHVPRRCFSYGGRKDRHGETSQLVTILDPRDLSTEARGYELEIVGRVAEPMGPGTIAANRFRITLRGLDSAGVETIRANIREIATNGFLNYFDDQRFRSYSREDGFAAAAMCQGRWEDALKLLLLGRRGGSASEKRRIAQLKDSWWDWSSCLALARTSSERRVFAFMRDHGADYAAAVNLVARDDLTMALSAFQSHLWNEVVASTITRIAPEVVRVRGTAGDYLLPTTLSPSEQAHLSGLLLPTPSARSLRDDDLVAAYAPALAGAGVTPKQLKLPDLRRAYFGSASRCVLVVPPHLSVVSETRDHAPSLTALTLELVLPRGSFATMLVKAATLAR